MCNIYFLIFDRMLLLMLFPPSVARGQFEYELVLKTDLYTQRHTQWYYFQVRRALPGVTYRFKVVNLLKKSSLYNHGE